MIVVNGMSYSEFGVVSKDAWERLKPPKHEWDNDACCIHCGMDGADWPRGEKLPACTVWSESDRARNRLNYRESEE